MSPARGRYITPPRYQKGGQLVVQQGSRGVLGQTLDSQIVEDRAGSSQAGRQPCRHYATSMTFRVNGCHDQQTTMTAIVNHFNYSSLARPSKGHYGLYQIHAIHFYSVLCQHIATGQEGLKGPQVGLYKRLQRRWDYLYSKPLLCPVPFIVQQIYLDHLIQVDCRCKNLHTLVLIMLLDARQHFSL